MSEKQITDQIQQIQQQMMYINQQYQVMQQQLVFGYQQQQNLFKQNRHFLSLQPKEQETAYYMFQQQQTSYLNEKQKELQIQYQQCIPYFCKYLFAQFELFD